VTATDAYRQRLAATAYPGRTRTYQDDHYT